MRAVGLHVVALTGREVRGYVDASADHHTPFGIVHGGFYAAIIETAASLAATEAVWARGMIAVGVNNNTDFLRPHVAGRLDVRGSPVQQGESMQLWQVDITNADGKLVARGQVRLFNRPRPAPS
jgi:uncharacterized protein (TIGR00369 family)